MFLSLSSQAPTLVVPGCSGVSPIFLPAIVPVGIKRNVVGQPVLGNHALDAQARATLVLNNCNLVSMVRRQNVVQKTKLK